ncbi:phytoene desaturase family protein [Amycolatopsis magusensis]|uniref:Phytoene desaturase n=1 Tax=Amycolatopsis magusensis TaxID=882444 RepID=A0ABS4PYB6_9PSEU|nr:phytoene desaturase family protein [Amycolatopsis magusensis]MBP2184424.1 phytoene desaturase [Amycolatopsis magusensis]
MKRISGPAERVVVVGAGLAGLAAAAHLTGRGRSVTVLDDREGPGGRASGHQLDGYSIDTGPTVLTMPGILGDTFAALGEELGDWLELTRLDPAYRALFADGSHLDVHTGAEAMAEAVRAFAGPAEAEGYLRLRNWLSELYTVEFDRFIASNFDSPLSLLTPQLAKLVAMGGFRSLDGAIGRFLSDSRLKRVFSFQSLYAGQSPRRALALYAVISYMDTVGGVFFPRGGMGAVPTALAAAVAKAGATFDHGDSAASLEMTGGRVQAVRTAAGRRLPCDAVVLTTELEQTYRLLGRTPRRLVPLRPAPSAVVLHAGTVRARTDVAHHSILFGEAWHRTFDEIIGRGTLMSDPSLLITRPTATDPALAPAGHDLYSILAPVPNLDRGRQRWGALGPRYADELARHVQRRMMPGFTAEIDRTFLLTPDDWAARGMVAGTPFSYAHTFAQTGPFRPANLVRGVENAVLAGAGTVPGVGVPTVLLSGRLAADRITGAGR